MIFHLRTTLIKLENKLYLLRSLLNEIKARELKAIAELTHC